MKKNEVLKNLRKNMEESESVNVTNAKYLKRVISIITKSKRMEYNGVSINMSQKGYLNLGCLLERIVFDYLKLEKEDNEHEIKCFVNNTTNILINNDTKVIYILLMSEWYNGLYKVDATLIRNIKLRKKYLFDLIDSKQMKKVASLTGLTKA